MCVTSRGGGGSGTPGRNCVRGTNEVSAGGGSGAGGGVGGAPTGRAGGGGGGGGGVTAGGGGGGGEAAAATAASGRSRSQGPFSACPSRTVVSASTRNRSRRLPST